LGIRINWNKYIEEWSTYKELNVFLNSNYMYSVLTYVYQEYNKYIIYPKRCNIFKAFKLCKPNKLKVVIIGSEPYIKGSANGLAFGNDNNNIKIDNSLQRIKRAVEKDLYNGLLLDFDYSLEKWAKQGVLLINTSLTVQHNLPKSHKKVWSKFIDFIVKFIAQNFSGTIFLLWGEEAQKYYDSTDFNLRKTCYVMKVDDINANWECDHFSKVNKLLE